MEIIQKYQAPAMWQTQECHTKMLLINSFHNQITLVGTHMQVSSCIAFFPTAVSRVDMDTLAKPKSNCEGSSLEAIK